MQSERPKGQDVGIPERPVTSRWCQPTLMVLLVVALIGLIRMWFVSGRESEFWSTAFGGLMDRTIGRFVVTAPPMRLYPMGQFEYWQPRIDRILADNPNDAELHAAAALITDSPSDQWSLLGAPSHLLNPKDYSISMANELTEPWRSMLVEYDQHATLHAIALANKAIEISPGDPRWLRLRASLIYTPSLYPRDCIDRSGGIDRLLEQARISDPDNGLYELISAAELLNDTVQQDYGVSGFALAFTDRSAAMQGMQLMRSASAKASIEIGNPAATGLSRLHRLAGHPKRKTLRSMISHDMSTRVLWCCSSAVDDCQWAGEAALDEDDDALALEFFSTAAAVREAVLTKSDVTMRWMAVSHFDRLRGYRRIAELKRTLNPQYEPEEIHVSAMIQSDAYRKAVLISCPSRTLRTPSTLHLMLVMLSEGVLYGGLVAIVLLASINLMTRRIPSIQYSSISMMAGAAAMVVTIVMLGTGPAGYVSETLQDYFATALIISALLMCIAGWVFRWGIQTRYRIQTLLILTVLAAVSFLGVRSFDISFPPQLHVETNSLHDLRNSYNLEMPEEFYWLDYTAMDRPWEARMSIFGPDASQWIVGPDVFVFGTMQWLANDGPAVTIWVMTGAVLLIGFFGKRFRDRHNEATFAIVFLIVVSCCIWAWSYPSLIIPLKTHNDAIRQYLWTPEEYFAGVREECMRQLTIHESNREHYRRELSESLSL